MVNNNDVSTDSSSCRARHLPGRGQCESALCNSQQQFIGAFIRLKVAAAHAAAIAKLAEAEAIAAAQLQHLGGSSCSQTCVIVLRSAAIVTLVTYLEPCGC